MTTKPKSPQSIARNFGFKSLTFKVIFLTVATMLVILAVFSLVFIISERQKTEDNIFANGKTFANFSAQPIYNQYTRYYIHPSTNDFKNFQTQVQAILAYNTDVKEVSMLAPNGRILFDSDEFAAGKKYKGSPRSVTEVTLLNELSSNTTTTRDLRINKEHLTEIIVPLQESTGGSIFSMRYLLAYSSLSQHMSDIYSRVAAVVLFSMVFVLTVAVLLSLRLTRPIKRLTLVAEQIRSGNFNARAKAGGNDEISRLAGALNEMSADLKGLYEGLEAKVHERTKALEATESQLMESVNRYNALLSSIADGVIATDATGRIVLVNKVGAHMLHLNEKDVLGKSYDDIWHLETEGGAAVKAADQPVIQSLKHGKPVQEIRYNYVRRDNDGLDVKFPVAMSVSPVILNQKIIGAINVFRDITKEKQIDRMKTEFISIASHQLRTPLSAIRWFSEMLENGDVGKLSTEQAEFVKNIADSTQRMIELVSSLLDISRIESGRIIVDPKPTDLRTLVQGIVHDLKGKTEERKQSLHITVQPDMPLVSLDPKLIGQVYLNLLTNAIKYTPAGGKISVTITRKGNKVITEVADNGYGIPKDQQSKMFQKFFRANNIIKVESDGTGLGMYLVKSIIESSDGEIWFESEENKGTTFWFSLPLRGMQAKAGEVTLGG